MPSKQKLNPEKYAEHCQRDNAKKAERRARERMMGEVAASVRKAGITMHPGPSREHAEYDPHRDGPPVYAHPFAELLGEPPLHRSALYQKQMERA